MWRKIKRVEGNYEVSSCGKIRNGNTNKILALNLRNEYLGVTVAPHGRKGKSVRLRVHRCVAEEWIEGYFDGAVVNHIDGNKLNNDISNLEWVTHSENVKHAIRMGLLTHKKGVDHPKLKLTLEQLHIITNDSLKLSIHGYARLFGVNRNTIRRWKNRDLS